MTHDLYTKITGKTIQKYTDIIYLTVNYVDDSTNIISTKLQNILQDYNNDLYILLEN